MRLSAHFNRINVSVTVVIMLIAGIIYYFTISAILALEVDKALAAHEEEILDHVKLNHQLPQVFITNQLKTSFIPVQHAVRRQFVDTTVADIRENDLDPARGLISNVDMGHKHYKMVLVLSTVETGDLVSYIFLATILITSLLVSALFIANRLALARLWKPFYDILRQIHAFNLSDKNNIAPAASAVDEFNELSAALALMTQQAEQDYKSLKEFTENAAHELMTPVSVLNSKMDTLLQTGEFSEQQSKLIEDIYRTVSRLTRLNRSMLLLAKIENRLIQDTDIVNVKCVLENTLAQFEDLISNNDLKLSVALTDRNITANPYLIETLITNLISNAIRHDHEGGILRIVLNDMQLSVSNSGTNGKIDVDQFFKRFQKSPSSEGIGLGLTICKQITEIYGFHLGYSYEEDLHRFTVVFDANDVK